MLGDVFKAIRVANDGMPTKEVAKRAAVSSTYISEIENGNKYPSYNMLKRLAEVFDIPLSQIILFEEKQEEENLTYQQLLILILQYYVSKSEEPNKTKKLK